MMGHIVLKEKSTQKQILKEKMMSHINAAHWKILKLAPPDLY
jgi:hypothetical protein